MDFRGGGTPGSITDHCVSSSCLTRIVLTSSKSLLVELPVFVAGVAVVKMSSSPVDGTLEVFCVGGAKISFSSGTAGFAAVEKSAQNPLRKPQAMTPGAVSLMAHIFI